MISGLKDLHGFSQTLCKTTGWSSIVLSMRVQDKPSVTLLEAILFLHLIF